MNVVLFLCTKVISCACYFERGNYAISHMHLHLLPLSLTFGILNRAPEGEGIRILPYLK